VTTLLEAKRVSRFFGGVKACHDIDLAIQTGKITSLIGPNGAGKTTLFNVITGLFPPTEGTITLHAAGETALQGLRPDEITASGIARTFQNIRLFQDLSVLQNVKLGEHAPTEEKRSLDRLLHLLDRFRKLGYLNAAAGVLALVAIAITVGHGLSLAGLVLSFLGVFLVPLILGSTVVAALSLKEGLFEILPLPSTRAEEHSIETASLAYLEFVGLLDKADEVAKNLAYGDQRRLEIARALASNPRLLLLDEPAAGMNPNVTKDLMALIEKIRRAGVTVCVIEHDMKLVMAISDYIYVLDHGELISEGAPQKVRNDPRVVEAYLGAAE